MPKVMSCSRMLLEVLAPGAACGRAGRGGASAARRRLLVRLVGGGARRPSSIRPSWTSSTVSSPRGLVVEMLERLGGAALPARARRRRVKRSPRRAMRRRRAPTRSGAGSRRARRTVGEALVVERRERDLERTRAGLERGSRMRSGYGERDAIRRDGAAAQGVRQRLRDAHVDEAPIERAPAGEVHHAVVVGAAGELGRRSCARRLRPARAAIVPTIASLIARACASSCACRRCRRASFTSCGVSSAQVRRRRARARAVDEARTTRRSRRRRRVSGSPRNRPRSRPGKPTMKSDDSADAGPRRAQPAHDRLVLERGVAALHRREHAVRARLHRQVHVADRAAARVA